MLTPKIAALTLDLGIAEGDARVAHAEALQAGLDATQPLSAVRLGELCALGEKMMEADLREVEAHRLLNVALH